MREPTLRFIDEGGKTKIEWRSDVTAAPKDRRVLMIATCVIPSAIRHLPDLVVAHWHSGSEQWVAGNVAGEDRPGARRELLPIYWAEIGELPQGTTVRPLSVEDFKG